ncbi:aminoglycoside phosphotransferase family protein [Streptomonospora halophila]|uniref:Aminoglycoside phosphotransferase family protein n=1 Tax=Streptomonospora halophila TaxID=427369 RepID=A0ABP9GEQ4_9ACTN
MSERGRSRRNLDTAAAERLAGIVCARENLDSVGLHRLGPVGANATFLAPAAHVVLRITSAEHTRRALREIRVAQWLLSEGIPVVRPLRSSPVAVDGRVATLWEEIPDPTIASTGDLGEMLGRLHALEAPTQMELPALEPLAGVEDYLDSAEGLDADDMAFLRRQLEELRAAYARLDFALPAGPIHGDAHRKNIVRSGEGRVVMLDLERVSIGPREWDTIVAATYAHLGWYTPEEYTAFITAYGSDVRNWAGFPTLLEIRKLRMTAWLCSRTGREPRLRAEATQRIATLRDSSRSQEWTPGV